MKKYVVPFFIFYTIAFSSCGNFKEITFSGIENIQIVKLSQKGVDAEITAKIINPNNVGFTIYKSEIYVIMNGVSVGKTDFKNNIKIKPNSEDLYNFQIKAEFANLNMTDLPKLISMGMSKNGKIGLKGNLKVGKLFVKKNYPINLTQNVPLKGL